MSCDAVEISVVIPVDKGKKSIEELNEGIKKSLRGKKYLSRGVAQQARNEYQEIVHSVTLHSQQERFNRFELDKEPWRKTAVGSTNGLGQSISQILQATYISPQLAKYPILYIQPRSTTRVEKNG